MAIAEHAWEEQQQPQWNNINVIDHARNKNMLLIKEALHVTMTDQQSLLNQNQGIAIADCWDCFWKSICQRQRNPTLPCNRVQGLNFKLYLFCLLLPWFCINCVPSDEDCNYAFETSASLKRRKKFVGIKDNLKIRNFYCTQLVGVVYSEVSART